MTTRRGFLGAGLAGLAGMLGLGAVAGKAIANANPYSNAALGAAGLPRALAWQFHVRGHLETGEMISHTSGRFRYSGDIQDLTRRVSAHVSPKAGFRRTKVEGLDNGNGIAVVSLTDEEVRPNIGTC